METSTVNPTTASSTATPSENSLVTTIDGEARISTLTIAEGTGNQHKAITRLVMTCQADLEKFGKVVLGMSPLEVAAEVSLLNEHQAKFVMVYLKNSKTLRAFMKRMLLKFEEVSKHISASQAAAHSKDDAPTSTDSIVIGAVEIHQDAEGRYRLNDLHRAAGGEAKHKPANFTRLDSTVVLIAEIDRCSHLSGGTKTGRYALGVVQGGTNQGTYVCKELVYAYAMWISASFHLKVIRVFDAHVTGSARAETPKAETPPVAPNLYTKGYMEFKFFGKPIEAAKVFMEYLSLGEKSGMEKNQAVLAANIATRALTGYDPLELMGLTKLRHGMANIHYTPTELGERFVMTGREFNIVLEAAGLQTKHGNQWMPTVKGRAYAVLLDVHKRKGTETPIQQLKWTADVLDALPALRGGVQ